MCQPMVEMDESCEKYASSYEMIHNSKRVQPRKGCGDVPSTIDSYVFRNVYKQPCRDYSRARIVFILMVTESYLYGFEYKPP